MRKDGRVLTSIGDFCAKIAQEKLK